MSSLREALETKKAAEGKVALPRSSFQDPAIQKVVNAIVQYGHFKLPTEVPKRRSKLCRFLAHETYSTGGKFTHQMIFDWTRKEEVRMQKAAAGAPLLYHTLQHNVVAGEVFNIFQYANVPTNAPKFSTVMFNRLVQYIAADHDEFWPLKDFTDRRRLTNPNFVFTGIGNKTRYDSVPTACATPNGDFAFNVPFMQNLMDWAYLTGEKPKGKKFICNGGEIPDEYGPVEFVIMHEFMHYSNGDFYYHRILKNSIGKKADMKVINWVGDFRSNYLLCKSGYQALPIGLYNDKINYDRQKTYKEMYDLVDNEMKGARKAVQAAKAQAAAGKPPKPVYIPQIGDVVENHDTHEVGRITSINPDGTIEVTTVDPKTLNKDSPGVVGGKNWTPPPGVALPGAKP